MEQHPASEGLDLNEFVFRLRTRWPWILASLLVAGALALLYLQVKAPVYTFRATMMMGSQSTGSKQAQELLKLLELKEKEIKLEDEIAMLSSVATIRQTLDRLPSFQASYFVVPDTWLNAAGPLKKREVAAEDMPFRVVPTPGVPQLTGVKLRIDPLPEGMYRVRADARKGLLMDLHTGELVRPVQDVAIDEVVRGGSVLRTPLLSVQILPTPGARQEPGTYYQVRLNDALSLVKSQQQRLKVRSIDHESHMIELLDDGTVPQKEQQFLDTLMSVMIANDVREKNRVGNKTVAFLDEELAKIGRSRQQAARQLSTFRSQAGVVDVGAQSSSNVQQLAGLQGERARLVTQRRYFQNMLSYLRSNENLAQVVSPASLGISDQVLNNLVLQLSDLSSQKAALGVNASDDNPMVAVLNEKMRSTREALSQNLNNQLRTTEIGLQEVDGQLGRVKGTLQRLPENERRLTQLQSESQFTDKNYTFLLEKRAEAAIALATNTTDKRVVDRALMQGTEATAPKPLLVGLLALLGGLLVPVGLILFMQKSNRRIQGKEDLARITDIPLLGVIAHASAKESHSMVQAPKGLVAESFRSVRVNLQYLTGSADKKVIGVTSSMPGEGKSFCAVHLAAELAHSGRRVLLLETDLRKPTLVSYFDMAQPEFGLATVLTGLSTFDESLLPTHVPGLDLLPCGEVPANATQLLEGPLMAPLMDRLRQEYDYVVLDTPPVGYVAEYFVLLQFLDANIYVVRQNYTECALLDQINDLHQAQKIKHVYLIINDVHFDKTYEYRHRANAYSYGYN